MGRAARSAFSADWRFAGLARGAASALGALAPGPGTSAICPRLSASGAGAHDARSADCDVRLARPASSGAHYIAANSYGLVDSLAELTMITVVGLALAAGLVSSGGVLREPLQQDTGQSVTRDGVTLPRSVDVGGRTLQLNGTATRKKFIVKVYVAGLYL